MGAARRVASALFCCCGAHDPAEPVVLTRTSRLQRRDDRTPVARVARAIAPQ